jgi:hypothetical protein
MQSKMTNHNWQNLQYRTAVNERLFRFEKDGQKFDSFFRLVSKGLTILADLTST